MDKETPETTCKTPQMEPIDIILPFELEPEAPEPFDFEKWLTGFNFKWNSATNEFERNEDEYNMQPRRIFMQEGLLHITESDEFDWWITYIGNKPATQEEAEILFRLLGIGEEESNEI